MAEHVWYKNDYGDSTYWYKSGNNVIRFHLYNGLNLCADAMEEWDKNWKLEQVPPGELVFSFRIN